MSIVDAALVPYRSWTEPRDGVGSNPFRLASKLEPPATTAEVSAAWPARVLPPELDELWLSSREAWLFQDIDYDQWGLHLLAPYAAASRTRAEAADRPGDFAATDAIVGEFIGDSDLLLVDGKGEVLVAMPLDRRSDWPCIASCLSEFLTRYLEAIGEKYWEDA